ncbi:competence type IV pilus minor pilin ComGD [Bacillus sp. CGMCC 1.16607]|uniref:competence type IV pilus minor pilin ComGD n=1 Tax=Bacillus sp. CGMCC 1.16607 TaxID=3351842 RepID=UPI003639FE68
MKDKGFTLIETLIVLSIVAIISLGSFVLIKPQKELIANHLFLTQFQSDLYVAQQYAIAHQIEVTVKIIPERNYYYIHERYDAKYIVERYYLPTITFGPGSLPFMFKFLPDGNVSHFGSLNFKIGSKSYKLTIQLGKGRFYIVES